MFARITVFKITNIFKIITALYFLLITASAYANITPMQTQQIQNLLNHWRASLGVPAATLSIALPDSEAPITFLSGTTTLEGSQKITPNTLFQAGSISKSFTSMVILQLGAQGKIRLDDYITRYLPQYSQWCNITIRQLLNHTSGIFDYTKTARFNQIRKSDPSAAITPEEMVSMAASYHPYFAPGKGWKYSNTNYVLAGMIIEKVTHQSVNDTLEYYLHGNTSLHLANTFYLPRLYSTTEIARMAHGYTTDGNDVTENNMSWAYTAGAIVSTTNDLLAWWQGLFQNQILSKQQLSQMTSLVCEHTSKNHSCIAGRPAPHLEARQVDKRYGLGIVQSSYGSSEMGTVWWHNGSTQGYKSLVMWFPKNNIYMALMINRDPCYLLEPNLPIVRGTLHTLVTGSYVSVAAMSPRPVKHHNVILHKHHHKHKRHPANKKYLAKLSKNK